MTEKLTEEKFLEKFPEIAAGYEAFTKKEGVSTSDYEFHAAYDLEDGTLNFVTWYPVGFDFSFSSPRVQYSWINYEAGEGFHLIDE